MTARTDRKLALVVGGVLAVLFILGAAVQVAFWTIGHDERTTTQTIPGPVKSIVVDARSGDVSIVPSEARDVEVDTSVSGSLRVPRMRTTVANDRVQVSGGCPDVSFGHCSAEIVVHLPAATSVTVTGSSGDITVAGVSAAVNVSTRSGDVAVDDLSGPVTLESRSGDVAARGLRSAVVKAQTASGDVNLDFTKAPVNVDAETASGDVVVGVPAGQQAYRVDVDTNSGDESVGVLDDPKADNVLRAHTHSGDVVVDYDG